MSYPFNIINETDSIVRTNSPFIIELAENPYANAIWELTLPPQINLIDTERLFEGDMDFRQWVLNALVPGTYSIPFTYRKQCCGRTVLRNVVYHISVVD